MVTERARQTAAGPSPEEGAAGLLGRLQHISEALVAPTTPAEIAAAVVDEVVPALGADAGLLALIDDDELVLVRSFGYGDTVIGFDRISLDSGLPIAEAVRQREPIWIDSYAERVRWFPTTQRIKVIHEALVAIPLLVGDAVIGSLGISFTEARQFSGQDRAFLVTVAQQCAIALERSRLEAAAALDNAMQYREEQVARQEAEEMALRLGRIQELSKELSRAMTIEEVVAAITDRSVPDLQPSTRGLWLLDDERLELRLPESEEITGLMGDRFATVALDDDLPIAESVRTRTPIFVASEAERDARYPALIAARGRGRSFAVLPLLVEDRVLGVLSLGFEAERPFDDDDRGFFVAIGEQCALALDRARLYQSERQSRDQAEEDRSRAQELARVLQTSLLPPELPAIPGVELAARYHPALEGLDVGGDFYDVFDTGGDWALVMGDVCGKGPEAAAVTALARYTLRSVATEMRQPASVLRRLNEVLYRSATDDRFCTVVYGRLVPSYNGVRVTLSCGGHLPPLVLRADGTVEAIGTPGHLIGVFPEVRLWEETVVLSSGDALVLYTDGVTEARRDGEELGEKRFSDLLSTVRGQSAAGIALHIEQAVLAFGGPKPRDDLALLVVRVS